MGDDLNWTTPTLKAQLYSQIIAAEMRLYNAPYTIPPEELGGPVALLTRKTDPLSLFYRGNAQLFERGHSFGMNFSDIAKSLIRSYMCSSVKPGFTHKLNWLPVDFIFILSIHFYPYSNLPFLHQLTHTTINLKIEHEHFSSNTWHCQ